MVLDINLFRSETTLDIVRKSHEKRGGVPDDIDDLVHCDEEWRKCVQQKTGYARLENLVKKIIGAKNKLNKSNKKKKNLNESENLSEEESFEDSPEVVPKEILEMIPDINQKALETLTIKQLIKISQLSRENKDIIMEKEKEHNDMRDLLLHKIGNILHETVPVGPNDDSNVIVRIKQNENAEYMKDMKELKSHNSLLNL
jgi:seryl-tRNA synthetase